MDAGLDHTVSHPLSPPSIHPILLEAFMVRPEGHDYNVASLTFYSVLSMLMFPFRAPQKRQLASISHTYAVRNDVFVMLFSAECCGQQRPTGRATGGRSFPVSAKPSQR